MGGLTSGNSDHRLGTDCWTGELNQYEAHFCQRLSPGIQHDYEKVKARWRRCLPLHQDLCLYHITLRLPTWSCKCWQAQDTSVSALQSIHEFWSNVHVVWNLPQLDSNLYTSCKHASFQHNSWHQWETRAAQLVCKSLILCLKASHLGNGQTGPSYLRSK